jgi:hypothetical protein
MMRNRSHDLAEHIVAALAPWQCEGLLSRRDIEDTCRSEGGSLPAGMTSRFGFECRLGEEEPVADFLVRIGAEPHEWSVLERYAAGKESDTWRRIGALLSERANPHSPLSTALRNLWLEYDLTAPMTTASAPSVFFGTDRLTRAAETGWAVDLVDELRGERLSAASRRTIDELIAVLPWSAKLFQVGIMCSRPHAPLRVCVIGHELGEISAFLAAASWPGEWPLVEETLYGFAPVIENVALDLDILDDGRLAPKLGVELYPRRGMDLSRRMIELITRLTDNDLCLPQKAIGLLAWGGITHERRYPGLWPAQLITRRSLRGGNESSTFCRWLHHIKIVLEPDAPATAKAYLAVSHAFLADSVIREALQRAALTSEKRG